MAWRIKLPGDRSNLFEVRHFFYELCYYDRNDRAFEDCFDHDVLRHWFAYARYTGSEVSFFTTNSGLLGLGTKAVQPGDIVALLPGPTTAILHRDERESHRETYKFCGLAYLPNIVHLPEDELEEREFVIT